MRKGFTIIELLVASLLLGLLVTILTMIFNQSSISWRVGMAGTADLRAVRGNIAEIREESDNVFVHDGKLYRITGLWDRNGNLRNRACDAPNSTDEGENCASILAGGASRTGNSQWIGNLKNLRLEDLKTAGFGGGSGGGGGMGGNEGENTGGGSGVRTYTVNVMSGGPNNDIDDWEAIWSFPYEFDE